MPRLSAIDAISPALQHMSAMLVRPFRFKTWLKIGFIAWLAGGAFGNFNVNVPSFPGGKGGGSGGIGEAGKDMVPFLRSWVHEHWPLIFLGAALIVALALVLVYLSSRFRFILFDSILHKDAQIGRGWARYGRPAQEYFGFLISFLLISGLAIALIVGLPLWSAYQRGVFHSDDPFAIIGVMAPVILGVFVFAIVAAIIASLANDFGVPLLALDDMTIGGAWRALRHMIAAEPWAYAGYLGMKLVLSIAAGIVIAIAGIFIFLILLIPGVIAAIVGVALAKAAGPIVGIILAVIGGLLVLAVTLFISMLLAAPIGVFFTSYALYFYGGRYPALGALLWPQPVLPPLPPGFSTGVPAPQGN
ncbi:MAG TPA: hypothetical protein VI488_00245 [Candidatus Angelobacter sp.]